MTITTTLNPQNTNNPTKEILASSGIYNGQVLAQKPYANDKSNTPVANTGINTTTTTTSTTPSVLTPSTQLSSGNYFIDDMLVFNNYIHNNLKNNTIITFNPRSFLEQANVTFNIYSLEYR